MQLIATRKYIYLDSATLEDKQARDALVKIGKNAFFLHMTSAGQTERLISVDARTALLWINQTPDEYGMNWE